MSDKPAPDLNDLELVEAIQGGSLDAWHTFVDRFSGLIVSVIRRYLVRESEDERRTIYVDILKLLHDEKLDLYDGRAALSTWVVVIARSHCLDYLRSRYGRREVPRWLRSSPQRDREIYRLYYLEGLNYPVICQKLSTPETPMPMEDLALALSRLEAKLDKGARRRMAYDLHARSVGATSGRLLEYLDNLRAENELKSQADNPENLLREREKREGISRLRKFLRELPDLEREVLNRYYIADHSARKVTSDLGLQNQRRAYTLIDKAIRHLRRMFEEPWEL